MWHQEFSSQLPWLLRRHLLQLSYSWGTFSIRIPFLGMVQKVFPGSSPCTLEAALQMLFGPFQTWEYSMVVLFCANEPVSQLKALHVLEKYAGGECKHTSRIPIVAPRLCRKLSSRVCRGNAGGSLSIRVQPTNTACAKAAFFLFHLLPCLPKYRCCGSKCEGLYCKVSLGSPYACQGHTTTCQIGDVLRMKRRMQGSSRNISDDRCHALAYDGGF